jgi:DNA repair protein RecN (Recombination protein N)
VLNHLHIRNLAVVDEAEAEIGDGLTVLTGETGAGKSILIDALGLALGERADSDAVRAGAKRAEVSATFMVVPDSPAGQWLATNDLEEDSDAAGRVECVLRRVVTAEGRSRGYINGNTVPMQTLRELGTLLVDICGQQAHQSLSKPDNQRALLDQQGKLAEKVAEHRSIYRQCRALEQELEELESTRSEKTSRMDLLSFQVQELEALGPRPGELEELDQAHRKAANASRIAGGTNAALQMLYENEQASAYELVSKARAQLDELGELDGQLAPIAQMLTEAEIQITEAADSLRHYLDQDPADSAELATLEARLSAMHDMARKHRVNAAELPDLLDRLRAELERIEHADDAAAELGARLAALQAELAGVSKALSKARKVAAGNLEKAVTANMRELGMPDGSFRVALLPLDSPGAAGAERVEFQVAINPGMRAGPLAKVASGGELSRVSLAIQVAASHQSDTPTLIFDEVDAGVGGSTAAIVGEKLRRLAGSCQVMCVTHLPQVASMGHQQFRISKLSDGINTRTRVARLTDDERVEELARMLGGVEITQRTRDHAAEMLQAAKN